MSDTDPISAANIADAAKALGVTFQLNLDARPLCSDWRLEGRAVCVRQSGNVDLVLEAIGRAAAGEILIIDNDGRDDEGCIGDLIVLEAALARLGGIVIWGRHRDSADLRRIGLPIFSKGSCASGPNRREPTAPDAFETARLGDAIIRSGDWIVADEDGVIILGAADTPQVRDQALQIRQREIAQAQRMRDGVSLREQRGNTSTKAD